MKVAKCSTNSCSFEYLSTLAGWLVIQTDNVLSKHFINWLLRYKNTFLYNQGNHQDYTASLVCAETLVWHRQQWHLKKINQSMIHLDYQWLRFRFRLPTTNNCLPFAMLNCRLLSLSCSLSYPYTELSHLVSTSLAMHQSKNTVLLISWLHMHLFSCLYQADLINISHTMSQIQQL